MKIIKKMVWRTDYGCFVRYHLSPLRCMWWGGDSGNSGSSSGYIDDDSSSSGGESSNSDAYDLYGTWAGVVIL